MRLGLSSWTGYIVVIALHPSSGQRHAGMPTIEPVSVLKKKKKEEEKRYELPGPRDMPLAR